MTAATWLEKNLPLFLIVALTGFLGSAVSWALGQPTFVSGFLILSTGALTTACGSHLVSQKRPR